MSELRAAAPACRLCLDRAALDRASAAAGYQDARAAVTAALVGEKACAPVDAILLGRVPASFARLAIATTLGVSAGTLWPATEEEQLVGARDLVGS